MKLSSVILTGLFFSQALADVVGSDTAVFASPAYLFPTSPIVPNRIAFFAWMLNGFTLTNSITSVLFDSVFPVSGNIQLNGGTLNINRDLILNNQATLLGLGTINGNGHVLSLSQNVNSFPLNGATFTNTRIFLNNDVIINSPLSFQATCPGYSVIEGNGHKLILQTNGSISINGNLILQNVILQGVAGTNVQCVSDSSILQLDNVTWIQTDTFYFQTGSFIVSNNINLMGNTPFSYETDQISVINSDASLTLNPQFTFMYDPAIVSSTLLSFVDSTAQLILNGATLQSTQTLSLTNGTLIVQGYSFISCDEDIIFGNDLNDFVCNVTPAAVLKVLKGGLDYHNVSLNSWLMESALSKLIMTENTILRLYESLDINPGLVVFEDSTTLERIPSAYLLGSTVFLGTTSFIIL